MRRLQDRHDRAKNCPPTEILQARVPPLFCTNFRRNEKFRLMCTEQKIACGVSSHSFAGISRIFDERGFLRWLVRSGSGWTSIKSRQR